MRPMKNIIKPLKNSTRINLALDRLAYLAIS
jgi:hypothetical protein